MPLDLDATATECTPFDARECPRCGRCTCPDEPGTDTWCPLHGPRRQRKHAHLTLLLV